MQLFKMPLSALETQTILGLPADVYDAVVSAGLLKKSAKFTERQSTRTSLHTFHDLLYLVFWAYRDTWTGILDQEGLCSILDQIEDARTVGPEINTDASLRDTLLRSNITDFSPEVRDEIQRMIVEIDAIWCNLLKSVCDELGNETQPIQRPLSENQVHLVKSVILSGSFMTTHLTAST